jgi:hypothetical protein
VGIATSVQTFITTALAGGWWQTMYNGKIIYFAFEQKFVATIIKRTRIFDEEIRVLFLQFLKLLLTPEINVLYILLVITTRI